MPVAILDTYIWTNEPDSHSASTLKHDKDTSGGDVNMRDGDDFSAIFGNVIANACSLANHYIALTIEASPSNSSLGFENLRFERVHHLRCFTCRYLRTRAFGQVNTQDKAFVMSMYILYMVHRKKKFLVYSFDVVPK